MNTRITTYLCILLVAALLIACGRDAKKDAGQAPAAQQQAVPTQQVPPVPPPSGQGPAPVEQKAVSPDDVVLPPAPTNLTNQTLTAPVSPDSFKPPMPAQPATPPPGNDTNGTAPSAAPPAGGSVSPDNVVIR